MLLLEGHCQTEMLMDLGYLLVDLTGADGMNLSATCPSFDTRVGVEAPRPTKAQADLLVVPDTAQEMVQYWLPAAPQVGAQMRLDFAPVVWLLPWS